MRVAAVLARIVMGVAILAAIVAQLIASLDFAGREGDADTVNLMVNFFSYFTIDANALAAVVLLYGAVLLAQGRTDTHTFAVIRLAVTTYMVITGIVYNLLLRGLLVQGEVVVWSNEVLHLIGPVYLLLDWLFAPGRRPLQSRDAVPALVFPAVWLVYTLVRGPFGSDAYQPSDQWYPYPFLNPVTSAGGYGSVAVYCVGIAVVVTGVAMGLAWVSRRRATATTGDAAVR